MNNKRNNFENVLPIHFLNKCENEQKFFLSYKRYIATFAKFGGYVSTHGTFVLFLLSSSVTNFFLEISQLVLNNSTYCAIKWTINVISVKTNDKSCLLLTIVLTLQCTVPSTKFGGYVPVVRLTMARVYYFFCPTNFLLEISRVVRNR